MPLASPVLFLIGALTRHWTTIVPSSLMAVLVCDPYPAFNRHKGESLALPVAFWIAICFGSRLWLLRLVKCSQRNSVDERNRFELLRWRFQQIIPSTGPFPIDGSIAESTLGRVVVNVVDRCLKSFGRINIAIESRALLPKSEAMFAWTLSDG